MVHVLFDNQKTAYEMRISDWSSDVCSSDLPVRQRPAHMVMHLPHPRDRRLRLGPFGIGGDGDEPRRPPQPPQHIVPKPAVVPDSRQGRRMQHLEQQCADPRSEEHTSELQSLMRISYAVFCLKKNKTQSQQ